MLNESNLTHAFYFEPIDRTLESMGGWGMLYADGRKKPIFDAFALLRTMHGEKLNSLSEHPAIGAFAVQDEFAQRILLWHSGLTSATIQVQLVLNQDADGAQARITVLNAGQPRQRTDLHPVPETDFVFDLAPHVLVLIEINMPTQLTPPR